MRASLLASLIAGVSIAISAATPALAAPDSPPTSAQIAEANRHFNQGVQLFKEGAAAAALAEFRRAYQLAPDWHVLYNVAQSHSELHNWAAAYVAFDQYSREAVNITPQRRADVDAQLKRLESRIGRLRITTNVADSEVFVDDESIGKTPLSAPFVSNLGQRKITVKAPGGASSTRVVEVAVGDDVTVDVPLVEGVPVAPPVASPVAPISLEEAPSRTWIGWTLAGALAGGAIVTGILAVKARGDADDAGNSLGVTDEALADANRKKHAFALTTDLLGGAALVTAGVTLYFTLTSPKRTAAKTGPGWSIAASPSSARLDYRF